MSITNVQAVKEHGENSEVKALREALNALVRHVAVTMPGAVLSNPAVKAGTSDATTLRNEAFTFMFRGKVTSAAAAETAFTATTHDVAASRQAWFVLSVQTDGTTFTITKAADQVVGTNVYPTVPDNEVPVGWLKITTGAGGIWDASTDDLSVSGNVVAVDFVQLPYIRAVNDDDVAEFLP